MHVSLHFEKSLPDTTAASGCWAWIVRSADHKTIVSAGATNLNWGKAPAPLIREALIKSNIGIFVPNTSTWSAAPGGWTFTTVGK